MMIKVDAVFTQAEIDVVTECLAERAGLGSNGRGVINDSDIGRTDAESALQKFRAAERKANG